MVLKEVQKTAIFMTALFAASSVQAENQGNSEQGERLYKRSCATCHGKQAEKRALGESAVIRQLKADEIITALQAHKDGKIEGAGNNAKARLSEQDMKDIAAFIQNLK